MIEQLKSLWRKPQAPTIKETFPVRIEHADPHHRDFYVVNWCLGNTCNYACTYCPVGLHDGSVPWPQLSSVLETCRQIIKSYPDKKLFFEFTGGEVTLWPDLSACLKTLKELGAKTGIISNGSRRLEFYQNLAPFLDQICLSFHPQSAKPDHFRAVIKELAPRIRTHVNVMMDPNLFTHCENFGSSLVDIEDISIAFQPLIVDFGDQLFPYSEEQKNRLGVMSKEVNSRIKKTRPPSSFRGTMKMVRSDGSFVEQAPHTFISKKENNWDGWDCHIGLEQLVVDMQGQVFRGWCKMGGPIGNVHTSNVTLPQNPIRCQKKMCHCNFDIMASKVLPKNNNQF